MMTHLSLESQYTGQKIGIFSAINDIGAPAIPGSASYHEPGQFYALSGSGQNIWMGEDSFSFLWKKMEGDIMIQARIDSIGPGTHPHRKTGIMIRSGLASDAAHVSCVIHGDGLASLQYRSKPEEDVQGLRFELAGPDVIHLEKKGNLFTVSVAREGELYVKKSIEVKLEGELAAGRPTAKKSPLSVTEYLNKIKSNHDP
ncbi:MAG: hypothetical protein V2B15_17920 [Bacteroidota bacterium]